MRRPEHNLLPWPALAVLCAGLCGCRTLDRSPVSQSVAECRQLTQQGVNALDRGDWRRAESLLEKAVATSTSDIDARRNYAETLWNRGAKVEALAQLEAARKIGACDPGLTVRTGEMYLDMGQVNSAGQLVDEALRVDPKFAPAWALRGRISSASGKPREALADYQRSLGYAPDNYNVAILVAETYRETNQPQQALVALQTLADRFPPGDAPQQVLHMQGIALGALGRHDDAARMLSQATQRERPSADLLCHLAQAELLAGHTPRAQYALQQALALDPQHTASQALSAQMASAGKPLMR
jgi:tetratricopeptide (TPR) repeat protein